MPDWELQRCCDHNQGVFIISVAVFTVVILAVSSSSPPSVILISMLWRTVLLTPFKLITVFLHETSHALACKLTCGDVRKPLLLLSCFFSSEFVIHALPAVLYWAPSALTSAWRFLLVCVVHCSLSSPYIHIITKQPARIAESTGVEGIQVHANEGGVTHTRGGIYWLILPAGCNNSTLNFQLKLIIYLGSSFWGMVFILASTNLLTTRIAAGCFLLALVVVLFVAQNWLLRGLCIGFIIFLAIVWLLQETTTVRILRFVILFIGVMNSLFSVYDIYDDLISRRVHSSDAEKFAEICPCPCNGVGWGVIWGLISFIFLCASIYLALVILS
ncbi:hypothetical protein ZIOFF_012584 [Zingiber officinale]|uniref:Uncharacterized protein n=1 Tax=Zingiber officinale TaxID=94328 RepID=A0A8J5LLM1_ZINOF|nr:hypothetical protein ZIOFF_012584 [Zingiber officinale]